MAEPASEASDIRRLRWQCRRGMRELDVILARYLEVVYPSTDAAEREVFEAFLKRQDPEISAWILGRETPVDPATATLVERLKTLYRDSV